MRIDVPIFGILVEELMTGDVVTVDCDAALAEAVSELLTNGVGSVIVLEDDDLAGIVTHSDIVSHLSDVRREASQLDAVRDRWDSG